MGSARCQANYVSHLGRFVRLVGVKMKREDTTLWSEGEEEERVKRATRGGKEEEPLEKRKRGCKDDKRGERREMRRMGKTGQKK